MVFRPVINTDHKNNCTHGMQLWKSYCKCQSHQNYKIIHFTIIKYFLNIFMLLVLFNIITKCIANYAPYTAAKILMISRQLLAKCLIWL